MAYYNDYWLQSPSLKGTWHSPYGYWYLQYGYVEGVIPFKETAHPALGHAFFFVASPGEAVGSAR